MIFFLPGSQIAVLRTKRVVIKYFEKGHPSIITTAWLVFLLTSAPWTGAIATEALFSAMLSAQDAYPVCLGPEVQG